MQLASGALNIGGSGATFNFPSGLLVWTGGALSGTLTNAATGVITFTSSTLGGTVNNLGTITQNGGTVNLINSSTFTVNSGTTNLSGGNGGTLTGDFFHRQRPEWNVRRSGHVDRQRRPYNITGTLTNSGTLALSGSAISPAYKLQGGTINGGTLSTTDGAELTATQSGGTLNGVTLAGTLFTGQILNTYVDVKGGLTLAANGLVTMKATGNSSSSAANP